MAIAVIADRTLRALIGRMGCGKGCRRAPITILGLAAVDQTLSPMATRQEVGDDE